MQDVVDSDDSESKGSDDQGEDVARDGDALVFGDGHVERAAGVQLLVESHVDPVRGLDQQREVHDHLARLLLRVRLVLPLDRDRVDAVLIEVGVRVVNEPVHAENQVVRELEEAVLLRHVLVNLQPVQQLFHCFLGENLSSIE